MYAIVDIKGKQFHIAENRRVKVPLFQEEPGQEVTLDRVLLLENDGNTTVGMPLVEGATITAEVEAHGKDAKVLNFQKKRRKGYKKLRGHRQQYTLLNIKKVNFQES